MPEPTVRADRPHRPHRPPRGRAGLRRTAAGLVLSLLVVGPWPVDDAGFEGSDRQLRTLERLERLAAAGEAGPIRVGTAEVDLTPRRPIPLAGFIGQVRTPYDGVDSPCLARALTVEPAGGEAVTILAADLLLINARLAAEVARRSGVGLDRIYFTASHTHGGPGGWGEHPLERLVAGAYDPEFFDDLAGRLADAVRRSRSSTVPAEMALVQARTPGRQVNRVDPGRATHDTLSALSFRPLGAADGAPPLAILAVFGAHATVSHPIPPRLGGDYPAALAAELKRRTGAGMVAFAAGAVGDASPSRPKARTQQDSARLLGAGLADALAGPLASARYVREVAVGSIRLGVDLGPLRLPFGTSRLRFSPLATWWIAAGPAPVQGLRLGRATLLGFPGDYAGHLAGDLEARAATEGIVAIATSFAGDFRGYLVSGGTYYRRPCYETRWMSFYGPWTGDYLTDVGRRVAERLAGMPPAASDPMTPGRFEPIGRSALAALLGSGLVLGSASIRARWRRLDLVSKAVVGFGLAAALAWSVAPGSVAWAGVGLPGWSRWLGLPLGLVALGLARTGRAGAWPAFAASAFLLSASWPIVLGTARGWLMAGPAAAVDGPPAVLGGAGVDHPARGVRKS